MNTIIIRRALYMRWCWNWQTGMVEGHVPQGVEVQVLSSAQDDSEKIPCLGIFLSVFYSLKSRLFREKDEISLEL